MAGGRRSPGAGLARRDGVPQFRRHLVVEGDGLGAVDLDTQHDAMQSSIMRPELGGNLTRTEAVRLANVLTAPSK